MELLERLAELQALRGFFLLLVVKAEEQILPLLMEALLEVTAAHILAVRAVLMAQTLLPVLDKAQQPVSLEKRPESFILAVGAADVTLRTLPNTM